MYTLLYLKWISNNGLLYTAHGTLPSVMWQPGWEGSLSENGYMHSYGWVPSLFTWNHGSIVNWLFPNTKLKVNKKKGLGLQVLVRSRFKLFTHLKKWCIKQKEKHPGKWQKQMLAGLTPALWRREVSEVCVPGLPPWEEEGCRSQSHSDQTRQIIRLTPLVLIACLSSSFFIIILIHLGRYNKISQTG